MGPGRGLAGAPAFTDVLCYGRGNERSTHVISSNELDVSHHLLRRKHGVDHHQASDDRTDWGMLCRIGDPGMEYSGGREPQKVLVLREDYPCVTTGSVQVNLVWLREEPGFVRREHIDTTTPKSGGYRPRDILPTDYSLR